MLVSDGLSVIAHGEDLRLRVAIEVVAVEAIPAATGKHFDPFDFLGGNGHKIGGAHARVTHAQGQTTAYEFAAAGQRGQETAIVDGVNFKRANRTLPLQLLDALVNSLRNLQAGMPAEIGG